MQEHYCQPSHRVALDKAVLMQLQTLTQRPEKEAIWDAFHLLDCVHFHAECLGPDAVQAIHGALWTSIQSLIDQKSHTQAISWCQLALHPCLARCRPENPAKFLRRILAARIELGEYADAIAGVRALPDGVREDLVTRFLIFRLAVRAWDPALAQECLHALARPPASKAETRDALYACVREAQQAGAKMCAVAALTAAASSWRSEAVVAANVPSLLRCAIRLLLAEGWLAAEFVADNARDENGEAVFHAAELRWFSTNAYNLGVAQCTLWEPGRLVSLFRSCLEFAQALASSSGDQVSLTAAADATLTMLRCHFVLASLYISEAQAVKNEHTQSLYADAEKHATAFTRLFTEHCGGEPGQYPDLLQKLGILCVFQFEALLARSFYDHLHCIVQHARRCNDADVLKALGGCLIQSEAPVKVQSSLLKTIVNEIFAIEKFKCDRLAQYLRCMVQVLLPMADDGAARELLDQAGQVARESKEVGVAFPADEAAWLAAAAFNHGLTRHAARRDMATCHAWLDRALAMAEHADDDGQFAASLRERQRALLAQGSLADTCGPTTH
ncbi:Meiosis specific protein SPO22 [Cordyceps javanica]|uniref:Meiosis specific protein SPO22 n=1 Tax=Cordyceps javanica TaxID=43265 RepID=A0A545VPD0_9HYPO|nr:Meiosis specific protein SPO22 [Cordyceps javanica]TQW03571.1 Meiosis specific protein SPO22 [Cordyceps javanica]